MANASAPRYSSPSNITVLYTAKGSRKYLTRTERERLLAVLPLLPPREALFVETLMWSGGRITEVLGITPARLVRDEGKVILDTLKRRRRVVREVALPPALLGALSDHFQLATHGLPDDQRLWPWHRVTAWRIVKRAVALADLDGPAATPRGFRHSYGVAGIEARVPVTLVQKWLGHARLETTSIYLGVVGPDEVAFAARMWGLKTPETTIVTRD